MTNARSLILYSFSLFVIFTAALVVEVSALTSVFLRLDRAETSSFLVVPDMT